MQVTNKYFTGSLTLLQLMAVLAMLGVVLTWGIHHYFVS
jgi:hypothetical protein